MLTPQDIFQLIAYVSIAAALVDLIILLVIIWTVVCIFSRRGKRLRNNLIATPLVLLAIFVLAYITSSDDRARQREMQAKAEARQKEYLESKAIFEERCKSAGEKIYQTVENVEGITLLNVPKESTSVSFNDPMWENAALPQVAKGDGYIRAFLNWKLLTKDSGNMLSRAIDPRDRELQVKIFGYAEELDGNKEVIFGYRYVDVKRESRNYLRYRYPDREYRQDIETLIEQKISYPSRYAVEYKPLVELDDRRHWIAGLTVNIYDMLNNTLMATKTWYAMAPSQGQAYQTDEWAHPIMCPEQGQSSPVRYFVTQVIKPKQGD